MDVKGNDKMITDLYVQHELLKTALQATDNYLFFEKQAKAAGIATSQTIHNFTYEFSRAYDALENLGVLDQHEEYMNGHVQEMMKLAKHDDVNLADLPFVHTPKSKVGEVEESKVWDKPSPVKQSKSLTPEQKAKAKARAKAAGRPYPNMVDNIWAAQQESTSLSFSSFITETEKAVSDLISEEEINEIVNSIKWQDIVDLYDDSELVFSEETTTGLNEKFTPQSRIKKHQAFARTAGKRGAALAIKLRRTSSMEVLKKRATIAARRAIYKHFLRGRDKSTLSAAEKDRIEQQVQSMKHLQQSIATKLLPRMRTIEQKRLAKSRVGTTAGSVKPGKAPGGSKNPKAKRK